jgi:hypothetical protein
MYLLQLTDRQTDRQNNSATCELTFRQSCSWCLNLEISRRVERHTISLKEGGYEEWTWNKAGTTGPVGPLEHGDSILGSINLRSVWSSRTASS